MPLPLVKLVGQVKGLFDYLVIATPYHDLAASEWGDARWTRQIDPFLLGVLKQVLELMFCLGRWSGTGLFPLIGPRLRSLSDYCAPKKAMPRSPCDREHWKRANHTLIRFTDRLLQRFEEGRLFSWLRGEGP